MASSRAETTKTNEISHEGQLTSAAVRALSCRVVLEVIFEIFKSSNLRMLGCCMLVNQLWFWEARRVVFRSLSTSECKFHPQYGVIRTKIPQTPCPLDLELMTDLKSANEYARCVRHLDISISLYNRPRLPHSVGSEVTPTSNDLSSLDFSLLESVILGEAYIKSLDLAWPTFLPSRLQKLKITTLRASPEGLQELARRCSNLRHLHIEQFYGDMDAMVSLVQELRMLEEFELGYIRSDYNEIQGEKLFLALAAHAAIRKIHSMRVKSSWIKQILSNDKHERRLGSHFRRLQKANFIPWSSQDVEAVEDFIAGLAISAHVKHLADAVIPVFNEKLVKDNKHANILRKLTIDMPTTSERMPVSYVLKHLQRLENLEILEMRNFWRIPWPLIGSLPEQNHAPWWKIRDFTDRHARLERFTMGSTWAPCEGEKRHRKRKNNYQARYPLTATMTWQKVRDAWLLDAWNYLRDDDERPSAWYGFSGQYVQHHCLTDCEGWDAENLEEECKFCHPRGPDGNLLNLPSRPCPCPGLWKSHPRRKQR